ncbi:hypothetical protein EDB81DRAFT_768685 [Dactylonectria macrodidyma]|uniref:Uncharacterized protein n=1 Tax=Dactylonectria macrodidyma TaxID=307937 RepID=A0A9P9D252_9HYPO|nr:hypothetical protein EDB81DRAFT_768685 [Dactylonectria macrodidyma]
MCRHTSPNTICGADRQFYSDKLRDCTRFRLFLCKHTEADIVDFLASVDPRPSPGALARSCGFDFGRDSLGRILLSKFKTQVSFLDKRVRSGKPLLRQGSGPVVVARPQPRSQSQSQHQHQPQSRPQSQSPFGPGQVHTAGCQLSEERITTAQFSQRIEEPVDGAQSLGGDSLGLLVKMVGTSLNLG